MLRAIIKRRIKRESDAECEGFKTIDFECVDIENELEYGGYSENSYNIATCIGLEVLPGRKVTE
jgi:hypothetical protein